MNREKNFFYLLMLVAILTSGVPVEALGPPTSAPPPTIAPSYDFFKSPEGLNSQQDFAACPVPGIYFEESSTPLLTGCETFEELLHLRGVPLETFLGVTVGNVDTAVHRTGWLDFGVPTEDVTVTTPIELVALNLVSARPIKIQCDQGVTNWSVSVVVDEDTGPSLGQMDVTLDYPDNLGGTTASSLDVCPRVTFTRVDPGASGSYTLHPCDVGCEFQLLGETDWSFTPPPGGPVLRIDGLTADNFYFTEPLTAEEQLALKTLATSCPCVFKYPHLSANHAHQACLPCPCDSDKSEPTVAVPQPATMECTSKGGSSLSDPCVIPPGHPDFVCSFDWLQDVTCDGVSCSGSPPPGECVTTCLQQPGKIRSCEAQSIPNDFLQAACGGHPNTVGFKGEDCCDNVSPASANASVLTVTDTRPPVVTPGNADLFILAPPAYPPNHDYVCFDEGDFTGVRQPVIQDVCFDYTWVFTDCAPDQPNNTPGSRNTANDCHVCQGANDPLPGCQDAFNRGYGAGEAFCVRAERDANDPAGRRYRIEVQPTDDCGNVGVPEVVGNVWVPRLPPRPPTCVATPTSGLAPLPVTFSQGTNIQYLSWEWDFDGDGTIDSTLENPPPYTYPAGTYDPTLTVSDGVNTFVATCPTIVVDPLCDLPNLKKNATDPDADGDGLVDYDIRTYFGPDATVSSITQDEPLTGCGTGSDAPDAEIDPQNPALFEVRSEACANNRGGGQDDGRVYHVTVLVNGQPPAACNGGDVKLCVPHDQRQNGTCVDSSPPSYDSTATP